MEENIINLNKFLSELEIMSVKLQNYHWNVQGHNFFIIHSKLEEFYDEIREQIDEIAEHILILGGMPLGRLTDYLNESTIEEANNEKISSCDIYKNITSDMASILNLCTKIKELADNENNYATSSLIDEYISDYSKKIWMLKQLQEK